MMLLMVNGDLTKHQIEIISENIPPSLFAVFVGIIVMFLTFYDVVNDSSLLLWTLAACSVLFFRFYVYLKIKDVSNENINPRQSRILIILSSTLTGVVWGIASILFAAQTDIFYWVFLAFFMSGYASGAVFSSSAFMPAFNGYFFSSLIPIMSWFFFQAEKQTTLMATLLLIFMFSAWKMGKNINGLLTEKFEARIHNDLQQHKLLALQTMAGGVAHDINNSLAAMIGNIALAKRQLNNPDKLEERLSKIEQSAEKACATGQKMLDYSSCNFEEKETISINQFFTLFIRKHPNIRTEIQPNLPSIIANKKQLTWILNNLIENALEACDNDCTKVSLSASLLKSSDASKLSIDSISRQCDYLLITVKDRGCGMTDDEIERAFDPFFSTKFTGRGLGLSSCYGIINGFGGVIDISSERSLGTSVQICIPINSTLSN